MKKIVLMIAFSICLLFVIASLSINTPIPSEPKDLILYRLSAILFFLVFAFGFAAELNIFKLKEKIPLTKSDKMINHFIFWFVILMVGIIGITIPSSMISQDYKLRLNFYMEEKRTTDERDNKKVISEVQSDVYEETDKTISKFQDSLDDKKETSESSVLVEESVNKIKQSHSPINKYNKKVYLIPNATFMAGNIEITIKTITFMSYTGSDYWGGQASGYRAEFLYTAKNISNDNHCKYYFNPLGKMNVNGTEFSLDWNYDNNLGEEYISQSALLAGMETKEYKLLYEAQTGIEPNDFIIYEDDDIELDISFGTIDGNNNDYPVSVQFVLNDFPSE